MEVGELAPEFVLSDETGTERALVDLLSEGPVVLFFYPGAMTYGCTKESCHFRDLRTEFEALGARPVGISRDAVDKQREFSTRHGFGFPLLSDVDGTVAAAYGVTRRFGHGVQRKTFVIDQDRRILAVVHAELSFASHADKALAVLRERAADPG
jgi:thioredoxin-dependent peroxiredoxin